MTSGSLHGGGANTAFCDGSARFVADQIDPKVWRALGTRDGNEDIDLSFNEGPMRTPDIKSGAVYLIHGAVF